MVKQYRSGRAPLLMIALSLLAGALWAAPFAHSQADRGGKVVTSLLVAAPAPGKAYYVDCSAGNDGNAGTSPAKAWRSLEKANNASLKPGEWLLLKRGCAWTGPLEVSWSGRATQPITVGAYGSGDAPIIKNAQYNVVISGSHLFVENLNTLANITTRDPGCDNQPIGYTIGYRFEPTASYVTLRSSGAQGHTHAVKVLAGSSRNRIVSNSFIKNTMMLTLDRENTTNDTGAAAIVLEGDDNVVAYNRIEGHDACSYDFERDGSAVELYGGQRNLIHHNTAVNNNTFTELGQSRTADNTFAYNLVTATVRDAHFLVSRGAGSGRGPVKGTRAFNNTVYLTDQTSMGVNCDGACGPDILLLKNNIIWSEGKVGYIDARADEGNNIFWKGDGNPGVFFPNPQDMSPTSRKANPMFVNASEGDFRPKKGSPAIDAGINITSAMGTNSDLAGVTLPRGNGVDIGAYEATP
jgi:hypothetical protein